MVLGSTNSPVEADKLESRQSPMDFGYRIINGISDGFSRTLQGLLGNTQPQVRSERFPKTPGKFNDKLSDISFVSTSSAGVHNPLFNSPQQNNAPALQNIQNNKLIPPLVNAHHDQRVQSNHISPETLSENTEILHFQQNTDIPHSFGNLPLQQNHHTESSSPLQSVSLNQPKDSSVITNSVPVIPKPSINLSLPVFSATNGFEVAKSNVAKSINTDVPHIINLRHAQHSSVNIPASDLSQLTTFHTALNKDINTSFNAGGLLSQLLNSHGHESSTTLLPAETVIHLNTGNSHQNPQELSFREAPNSGIRQKLHFGGWVGVPEGTSTGSVQIGDTHNSLSTFRNNDNNGHANSNVVFHPTLTLKPIFIPADRLIPPFHSDDSSNLSFERTNMLNKNGGQVSLASQKKGDLSSLPQSKLSDNHNLNHHHIINHIPEIHSPASVNFNNNLQNANINGGFDQFSNIGAAQNEFFNKGGKRHSKHGDPNSVNNEQFNILSAFSNAQRSRGKNIDPHSFVIHQTLQLPERDDTDQRYKSLFSNSNDFSNLGPLSGALQGNDHTNQLLNNGKNDNSGSLTFTHIIDDANPSQIIEAQKILTAIPSINISQLLHSDNNATHSFETQLILKSLLSFRKKPTIIGRTENDNFSNNPQDDFFNFPSPTVNLNSFVTPPSIRGYKENQFSNFHNKQGMKEMSAGSSNKNIAINLKSRLEPPRAVNANILNGQMSSRGRQTRDDTRFNKISSYSESDKSQNIENLWKIYPTSSSPHISPIQNSNFKTKSTSPTEALIVTSAIPAILKSNNSKPHVKANFQISPWSHELGHKRIVSTNGHQLKSSSTDKTKLPNDTTTMNIFKSFGKSLTPPNLQLQIPLRTNSERITPRPAHQFGTNFAHALTPNHQILNSPTTLENPSNASPTGNQNLFTTSVPIIESFAGTQGFPSTTRNPRRINSLFQSQRANFTKIIVEKGPSFNVQQIRTPSPSSLVRQPNVLNNSPIFLPNTLSQSLQPPISPTSPKLFRQNIIVQSSDHIIPHKNVEQFPQTAPLIEGNGAFSFLETQRNAPSSIPINSAQRITADSNPESSNAPISFSGKIVTNLPFNSNIFVTELGENDNSKGTSQNVNARQTKNDIKLKQNRDILSHNLFASQLPNNIATTAVPDNLRYVNNRGTQTTDSGHDVNDFFARFRNKEIVPTRENVQRITNISNQLVHNNQQSQFPLQNINNVNTAVPLGLSSQQFIPSTVEPINFPQQSFRQDTSSPRPFQKYPRINTQSLPNLLSGGTSDTVQGLAQINSESVNSLDIRAIPQTRKKSRYTTTTSLPVRTDSITPKLSFGNTGPSTALEFHDEFESKTPIVPFNPWPSLRLRGNTVQTTTQVPTQSTVTQSPTSKITQWNPFQHRFTSPATQPTTSPITTANPEIVPNRISVFEEWLRTRSKPSIISPQKSTIAPEAINPNNGDKSIHIPQNNRGPKKTWRRRIRNRTSFNKRTPLFDVAETNVEEILATTQKVPTEKENLFNIITEEEVEPDETTANPIHGKRRRRIRPTAVNRGDDKRENISETNVTA